MDLATSSSSPSADSAISCRICKFASGPDLVQSPCHCKGSLGMVHVSCLEEWLSGSTRNSCELCSATFKITRLRKYSCCTSIWIYFRNSVNIFRLLRDFLFLAISIMNMCILSYIWLTISSQIILNIFGFNHPEFESLMKLSFIRSLVYFSLYTICAVFVTMNAVDDCRRIFYYYLQPWYYWWNSAVSVKLILDVDEEEKLKDE